MPQTTRRTLLAVATAAVSAGCIGGDAGQQRGIAGIKLYNPADQPRETELIVSDDEETLLDSQVTVPPRATVRLNNRIVMEQTVTLAVTRDGTSTAREWAVQGSMRVTFGDSVNFRTEAEIDTPRGNRDDGRVDVSLQTAGESRHGTVTVARGDTTLFTVDRRVPAGRRVVYHDRLDASGEATVTLDGGREATEQLSLADAVQLIAHFGGEGFIDVNRAEEE